MIYNNITINYHHYKDTEIMHSYIISTNTDLEVCLSIIQSTLRLDQPLTITNNPDISITGGDDQTIKIDQIREIKRSNLQAPVQNPYKIVIIQQADKMTKQSQNALLKLLEEPNTQTKIFLITSNPSALLTTIHSRCQIIKIDDKQKTSSDDNNLAEITQAPLTKRLTLIDPHTKDRETALKWIESAMHNAQRVMEEGSDTKAHIYLKNLQTAHTDLNGNLNVKLTMDRLILNLEK